MPPAFGHLERRARRKLIAASALRIAGTTTLLLALYYLLPLEHLGGVFLDLLIGGGAFIAALTWQMRSILVAEHPVLRAVEIAGISLPLLVTVFATIYVSMATDPASFSQDLSRSASLYFTVTVFSTVGFGDIVPTTDAARLVVSVQMLVDLVLLGTVVRLLAGAARSGLARQATAPAVAADRSPTDHNAGAE